MNADVCLNGIGPFGVESCHCEDCRPEDWSV